MISFFLFSYSQIRKKIIIQHAIHIFILIFLSVCFIRHQDYTVHRFMYWVQGKNVNQHIYSYDSIINYIKTNSPNGATIATAEPGALGFKLGPRYTVIDVLGLISPDVARNIILDNLDYPFQRWDPEYVIVSWRGNYDPIDREWFPNKYELKGEFKHEYWTYNLKRGAFLYRKKNNSV